MFLPLILLALCFAELYWFLRNDLAEYAAFKKLTDTRDRQRRIRIWILRSFLLFFGGTAVCLTVLRRLDAPFVFPSEFQSLAARFHAAIPGTHAHASQMLLPFMIGAGGGVLIGILLALLFARRSKPVRLGDIDALMPRNRAETAWMALISVDAGVSEELFFRLLLPLLLTLATRSALTSFLIAAVIFGLVHLYQRLPGILATTLLGLALSAVYLITGNLWIAVLLHIVLDLIGVVVRPSLERWLRPAAPR
jgi:membrane protease YdiL (CAAX protease family)